MGDQDEGSAGTADGASYRSGVAARLAGVPVETLRVWERRYRVIGPRTSPRGQRLYSSQQIQRLVLIKQLVDLGHPIGAIARLEDDALEAMRATARSLASRPGTAGSEPARRLGIALVGPLLAAQPMEDALAGTTLRVVATCSNLNDAEEALRAVQADVVLVECAALSDGSVDTVAGIKAACGALQAIVLYRFAPSVVIRALRTAGHEVARAPADAIEIVALCRALLRVPHPRPKPNVVQPPAGEPPPPRFDERALSAIAGASNTLYCECPRHIVDLVLSLGSFERYSVECANRTPDDAVLHRDLQRSAAHARALMEEALLRVSVAEGLPLPDHAAFGP